MNPYSPIFRRLRCVRCFSLTEMLVTVAIIAILIALLIPAGNKAVVWGRDMQCKQRLRELYIGYQGYAQDNDGRVLSDNWTEDIQPYVGQKTFSRTVLPIFRCPAADRSIIVPSDRNLWWKPDFAGNFHGALYGGGPGNRIGLTTTNTAPPTIMGQQRLSQVAVFMDWRPGTRFARKYEFEDINGNNKERVYRHSGKLNAVFLDGHIESFAYPIPTDPYAYPWQ